MLQPVHFRSDQQIEARAAALLRTARTQGIWTGTPPVPVELIVESVLDLAISWEEVPASAAAAVLGFLHVEARRVVINEGMREHYERYPGALAFTIGHEAGHYVLHVDQAGYRQITLLAPGDALLCRDGAYDPRELQANRFAAFLLIPDDLVRPATLGRDCGDPTVIRDLATTFAVSATTMRIRLEHLGIAPRS